MPQSSLINVTGVIQNGGSDDPGLNSQSANVTGWSLSGTILTFTFDTIPNNGVLGVDSIYAVLVF